TPKWLLHILYPSPRLHSTPPSGPHVPAREDAKGLVTITPRGRERVCRLEAGRVDSVAGPGSTVQAQPGLTSRCCMRCGSYGEPSCGAGAPVARHGRSAPLLVLRGRPGRSLREESL